MENNDLEIEKTGVIHEGKEKRIETVELEICELKTDFGNPRKINPKKKKELEESLEEFGDFGLFLIDEKNNVIAGNQRRAIINANNPHQKVLCKRLVGYTEAELRSINLKDNLHAGEWDLDKLADWTADLNIDLGLSLDSSDPLQRVIPEMELIHYEKYNYVMIVCRNEIDYNDLVRKLGIEGAKITIAKSRKISARAIWYDQMKCQLVDRQEVKNGK